MIPKTLVNKDFFEHLAYLFHAVSYADKKVERIEKLSVIKEVDDHWLVSLVDKQSDMVIYETLKKLIGDSYSSQGAFDHFKLFYNVKKYLFTNDLKAQMLLSLENVARSVAGVNKSELIMLHKIKLS